MLNNSDWSHVSSSISLSTRDFRIASSPYDVKRWSVLIDYDNIHVDLSEHKDSPSDTQLIILAIQKLMQELGEIVQICVYVDWAKLSCISGKNVAAPGSRMGVRCYQQTTINGKNSIDMCIVDDIEDQLLKDLIGIEALDGFLLVTCDRDFRKIIEKIIRRGKKPAILAPGTLAGDLKEIVKDGVYCLEDIIAIVKNEYLAETSGDLSASSVKEKSQVDSSGDTKAILALKVARWFDQNPVPASRRDLEKSTSADQIAEALQEEILCIDRTNGDEMVSPNRDHQLIKISRFMIKWLPKTIDQILHPNEGKGMRYAGTELLTTRMENDDDFRSLEVNLNVKRWLFLAAEVGIVIHKIQRKSKVSKEKVDTWCLPIN